MSERTSRGFDAPTSLPERLDHERERFLIVRISLHELDQVNVSGRRVPTCGMRVLRRDDGTYDAIRYPLDVPLDPDLGIDLTSVSRSR